MQTQVNSLLKMLWIVFCETQCTSAQIVMRTSTAMTSVHCMMPALSGCNRRTLVVAFCLLASLGCVQVTAANDQVQQQVSNHSTDAEAGVTASASYAISDARMMSIKLYTSQPVVNKGGR